MPDYSPSLSKDFKLSPSGNEPSLPRRVYLEQVDIDSLTLEDCLKLMTTEQQRLVCADCVETVFNYADVPIEIVEKGIRVASALRRFARGRISYEAFQKIELEADLKWPQKYYFDWSAREEFMEYQLGRARYYLRRG